MRLRVRRELPMYDGGPDRKPDCSIAPAIRDVIVVGLDDVIGLSLVARRLVVPSRY